MVKDLKPSQRRILTKTLIAGLIGGITLISAAAVWAHEGHHEMAETGLIDSKLLGFTGLEQVFNIHPVFVHFPIALLPSALFLYGLGIILNWRAGCVAGRACLYLSTVSTAIAIGTGLIAQTSFPHNERIHHMMLTHLHIGLLIMIVALLLAGWSFFHKNQRPRGAYPFLALLVFAVYLVLQNGDLGSRMVYVEGAAVKPAVSVITGSQGEEAELAMPHHHEAEDESVSHQHAP